MTNTTRTGDLLTLARLQASRRLNGLAKNAHRFEPEQLTLLASLLDEFARKSRKIRTQENTHD
ncbi:hypothetical protein [Prescottella agglutinans]|uniref:Uncharacterized protein n=1 Tax=Prescottella agglutinans TaxID=1644129 RepID=A0ABT6MGC7_9NOCA|nr:hypothetical protein [Prescottella agglutinans]MDH6283285.1 hypothetical protein [Prescottella agglutinans]